MKESFRNGTGTNERNASSRVAWGISPPGPHRFGHQRLRSSGSYHPVAFSNEPSPIARFLPSLVDQTIRSVDPTPSLHLHSRDFNTTASGSAPVPASVFSPSWVLHFEFLPYYRNDRFPRPTQEPGPGSRHLYAGRRPDHKQVSPGLILEGCTLPVSTSSFCFRHLINAPLALVCLNLT
jgi:hypothetical protein